MLAVITIITMSLSASTPASCHHSHPSSPPHHHHHCYHIIDIITILSSSSSPSHQHHHCHHHHLTIFTTVIIIVKYLLRPNDKLDSILGSENSRDWKIQSSNRKLGMQTSTGATTKACSRSTEKKLMKTFKGSSVWTDSLRQCKRRGNW